MDREPSQPPATGIAGEARFSAGQLLADRYRVEEFLAQGGMAAVYRAEDTHLGSPVALKILFEQYRSHPVVCARFRQEVVAARQIVHPCVIRIFDLVETDPALFLTMEYFAGEDAKFILREQGAFDLERALRFARVVSEGLEVAHVKGIVHGDVKPHNVLIDEQDELKIVDFGMARVNSIAGLTAHSLVLGTPEYAAPELFTDRYMDARADIYSLGATMFELLTGRAPFRGKTPYEVIHAKTEQAPPSIRDIDPDLPRWLDSFVQKAMSKAPEDRFQTMAELRRALDDRTTHLALVSTRPSSEPDGTQGLQVSTAEHCRHCGAPLIRAFSYCFACGQDTAFIRPSAKGEYMVCVVPKGKISTFSSGYNPHDTLTYQQKYHIVERLKDALPHLRHDSRQLDKRLRYTPFAVINHLESHDAEKLRSDLEENDIPAKIIKDDFFSPIRFLVANPADLVGVALLTLITIAIVGAFLAVGGFRGISMAGTFIAAIIGLSFGFQRRRLTPLSELIHRRRRWGRSQSKDLLAFADEERAAVEWLVPSADALRGAAKGEGLKRTLNRLMRRTVELERAMARIEWLDDAARQDHRRHLEEALERATEVARSIQAADDFLAEDDETEVFETIEHITRRLTGSGRPATQEEQAELTALRAEQEALMARRDQIERVRSRDYAALLRLITSMDGLHTRLTELDQREIAQARSDLREALAELDAEIEGISQVEDIIS